MPRDFIYESSWPGTSSSTSFANTDKPYTIKAVSTPKTQHIHTLLSFSLSLALSPLKMKTNLVFKVAERNKLHNIAARHFAPRGAQRVIIRIL